MTTTPIADIALGYIKRGWNPVPVKFRDKKPTAGAGWNHLIIDETTVEQYFNGAAQNIGVQLGANSHGLTDIDLDTAEAIALAPYVLHPTNAIFGRKSARDSHRLYYTDLALSQATARIEYKDPAKKGEHALLFEVRIGAEGHAAQTVFPGSVHKTDEPIKWEEAGEPPSVAGEELLARARRLAAYCLLARYWPATGSGCHDAALVAGGVLARTGLRREMVRVAVEAITRFAAPDRQKELARTAEDAAKNHHDGKPSAGLTKLRETFGIEVADKIAEWLGYREQQGEGSGPAVEQQIEWPEPYPLPASLLPVAPFDQMMLPAALWPFVEDIANRMQAPVDFVAASAMTAVGSIIGRKVGIRPKMRDDWTVIANLWTILVGRPSVYKSPTMKAALGPLYRLIDIAKQDFDISSGEHELRLRQAKLKAETRRDEAKRTLKKDLTGDITHLLKNEELKAPQLRRYIANDTNVASLGKLCAENSNGLLVFRDELISLLETLDQEERVCDRGFYLTGWNGDSDYIFDRIARGTIHIPGVCLSLLGGAVPGRLQTYVARALRGGRGDDGLIQRFGMLIWPDVLKNWQLIDRLPNAEAAATAFHLINHLNNLDARDIVNPHGIGAKRDLFNGEPFGLPYLRFEEAAFECYAAWLTEYERRLASDELHRALQSHFAKYRKLIPGLALICHLADRGQGPVTLQALERALLWAAYLETHAQRAYSSATVAEAGTARAILAKIASGHLRSPFRSHDVWRPGWALLNDRETVAAGLRMLVDYDWLASRRLETAGRPATIYTLNPKAKI
jgi:hypothetical protein